MKKILIVIVILILLALAGVLAWQFLGKKPAGGSQPGTTFPGSGTTPIGQGGQGTAYTIPLQNGTSVAGKDFIHNGITFEDPANKGSYYLAGTNGLCRPDGTCPKAGTSKEYVIIYSTTDNSFVIGLTTEPLGQVRKEAEQSLMQTLGITEEQMCQLNYTIGTTVGVNPAYGGENLGFSFCPGATKLP